MNVYAKIIFDLQSLMTGDKPSIRYVTYQNDEEEE